MPRLLMICCVLVVAGCGANSVTAGVEVVESRSDLVGRPGSGAFEQIQSQFGDLGEPSGRPPVEVVENEFEPAADIVSGPSLPPRPNTVAVIGDSLTLSAQEEISAVLESSGIELIMIDGVENRRMTSGSSAVPPAAKTVGDLLRLTEPDLWVFALGTNDVGAQTGTEVFREDMGELLDLLPPTASVIWVDLWIRDFDDRIVEANAAIRLELAGRRGVAAVVDWHTRAAQPGIITGDGVHLTEAGQQLFADSILGAIDSTFAD